MYVRNIERPHGDLARSRLYRMEVLPEALALPEHERFEIPEEYPRAG